MPEYVNPNNYTVHLVGPDGNVIRIKGLNKVILPDFFEKYCSRGFLKKVSDTNKPTTANTPLAQKLPTTPVQKRISSNSKPPSKPLIQSVTKAQSQVQPQAQPRTTSIQARKAISIAKSKHITPKTIRPQQQLPPINTRKNIVGKTVNLDPMVLLRSNLDVSQYSISNSIGVGILSYNRGKSLCRLIDSITKYTDLRQTTIFVSDDASTDPDTIKYLNILSENNNIVVIRNKERLGIAGNTNRILRCLARFNKCILLNDDVEILNNGWDNFYFDAMTKTNMVHFIYRHAGIYGATLGQSIIRSNQKLYKVDDKPHGAVLAFKNDVFAKIGYFDESYGLYGMEHVDWSQRVVDFGLQEPGFFDVVGSDKYFIIHNEQSSVSGKSKLLQEAKEIYSNRIPVYVDASDKTMVPAVSYVIPFRDFERSESIRTVINNIRAQKFPVIDIVMSEHDSVSQFDVERSAPIRHILNENGGLFNKSTAFNVGVVHSKYDKIILHDADMLAPNHYTSIIYETLDKYDACHLGNTVIYTTQQAMEFVNNRHIVDNQTECDRVVGYYEGGSLACRKSAYWAVGGFNEDYVGYGCEDCDFYSRISFGLVSIGMTWIENRVFDFLHLWHSRVHGWNNHHEQNKLLEASLNAMLISTRISLQLSQARSFGYIA